MTDDLKNACGFCGVISKCDIEIIKGSGRGQTASEVPKSRCEYFEKLSIVSAGKGSQRSPCTNRPCEVCKRVFWSYNMYQHYEISHSDHLKSSWVIKEEERIAVIKTLGK